MRHCREVTCPQQLTKIERVAAALAPGRRAELVRRAAYHAAHNLGGRVLTEEPGPHDRRLFVEDEERRLLGRSPRWTHTHHQTHRHPPHPRHTAPHPPHP